MINVIETINTSSKRLGIKETCQIIREILAPLGKERRVDILMRLPPGELKTFKQLEAETGFSKGSLHEHLGVLVNLGYVHKTDGWPAKYYCDEDLIKLCEYAAEIKAEEATSNVEALSKQQKENVIRQEAC
jgi:DNA-binding HxlR family transcriptional regulator